MKTSKGFRALATGLSLTMAVSFGAANAAPILWVGDSDGTLGTVDVASGTVSVIGQMGQAMTDIAFDPSGDLWGITFNDLYQINKTTAAATLVGNLGSTMNALVFGSGGTLYGAGGSGLYTINTSTGAASLVGGGSYASAGDLAFVGGTLYLSSTTPSDSSLFSINAATGAGTNIGAIGAASVYGMATDNSVDLYGLSGNTVLSINTATGAGTSVQTYSSAQLGVAWGSAFLSESGADVPEPTSLALLGLGLAGLAVSRRREQ